MSAKRRQLMADASEAASRGDHERAATLYRRLLEDTPSDERVLQRLGDALAASNQTEEAVATFEKLGDVYWSSGHAPRALAVLRRAIKLAPESGKLLLKIGTWQLDRGHMADAREPLMQAIASGLSHAECKDALTHFRRISEQRPTDLELHRAQIDVAAGVGDPAVVAKARVALAVAFAASDQADEAAKTFGESIEDDPEGLTAMLRTDELSQLCSSVGADRLVASLDDSKPAAQVAASLLKGLAAGLAEDEQAVIAELDPLTSGDSEISNRHRLRLARVLGTVGQPERALTVLQSVPEGQTTPVLRRELRAELRQLHRRHPQLAGLAEARSAVDGSTGIAGPTVPDPAAELDPDQMPEEIRARLVEVEALANHDLHARALEILGDIPAPWCDSAPVREAREELLQQQASDAMGETVEVGLEEEELLIDELAAGGASKADAPSAAELARAAEEAPVEPVASRTLEDDLEDDLLILLEEDGELESTDSPVPEKKPALNQSPESNMGDLDQALQKALDEEIDDETVYQMASGLVHMELHQQAVPLLERCLEGTRCVEAATSLIEIHTKAQRVEEAAEVARKALLHKDLTMAQRADILASAAGLALRLGDHEWLNRLVGELETIAPGHPALSVLRAQV